MSKKKTKTSWSGRTGQKSPVIVKNKTVLEEITFKGEKIMRQKIVKEWDIPDIITGDIGFQLMFGFQSIANKPKKHHNMEEYDLGEMIQKQY
tara:strand:- start:1051 stop:1326 length:276 start_codon:yes stop_codon:yes gene_type:complete